MRIELLFPPPWNLNSVIYLALPTLSAYLRHHGVEVVQRDINLEVCELLLQQERLEEAKSKIKQFLQRIEANGNTDRHPPTLVQRLNVCWSVSDHVIANIEQAIQTLKSETCDRVVVYRDADIVSYACLMLSVSYYPTVWNYNYYRYDNRVATQLDEVYTCVFEDETNLFLKPYQEKIVPKILEGGCKIFGISIPFIDQLIPGLTLARVIKEQCPEGTVIIGGPLMPYLQEALFHFPQIFSIIDFAIPGEAEIPLHALLKQLEGERKFKLVPSLIYRTGKGEIKQTSPNIEISMAESVLPDFDCYNLDQYWTGTRSLPYLSERGCYWRKCAFCSINSTYGRTFRVKPIPTVIEELKTLKERYTCNIFEFSDEAMGPARMERLSHAIIESDLSIYWFTLARVEKQFSAQLFSLAYRAGCRVISWGIESGSQRVLDRMNKKTKVEEAMRVLKESHESGLWNNIFIMIGFPGETDQDLENTMAFISEANEWIHSIVYGPFRLEKCTAVFESPQKFGVKLKPYPPTYCRPDYEYWEESQENTSDIKEKLQRFEKFIQGIPGYYYPTYTLGHLISSLATSRRARDRLRVDQQQRADLHLKIREIFDSPQDWRVVLNLTEHCQDVENFSDRKKEKLFRLFDPESGNFVILGEKLIKVFNDTELLQQTLIRMAALKEGPENERSNQFFKIAESAGATGITLIQGMMAGGYFAGKVIYQ